MPLAVMDVNGLRLGYGVMNIKFKQMEKSNKGEQLFSFTFKEDLVLNCLSFFAAGIGKVGIRNNCPDCMTAVVHWTPTVGTKYYRANGHNQLIINVESQTGQLIGEQPC